MRSALFALQAAMPALLMLGVFIAIILSACLGYCTMLLFHAVTARFRRSTSDERAPGPKVLKAPVSVSARNTLVSTDPHYFDLVEGSPLNPANPPAAKKKRDTPESPSVN